MANETIDQKIQRLQQALAVLQSHAQDMDAKQHTASGNVSPLFDVNTLSLIKIDQAMSKTLVMGHTFPTTIPQNLSEYCKRRISIIERTNDDFTAEEFIVLRPFLPSDFLCQGDVSSLPNKEHKAMELERQIFFLCMYWQGTTSRISFSKEVIPFPFSKTTKESREYDNFCALWVKAARQAPSYLTHLKVAYLAGKTSNGELYYASQVKSRNLLISDAKSIVNEAITTEMLALYKKHSFLFSTPITRENAITEIMKTESELKDLYTGTIAAIDAISSVSLRHPEYLFEKPDSAYSSFSSGSLTSLFRKKDSSEKIKTSHPGYSIVEIRDYLGVQVRQFIDEFNQFSFLRCLEGVAKERFQNWIDLRSMITSELDAMLFNLNCDISFNQSLSNEYANRSYVAKMLSQSLYSLHKRRHNPSDALAIKQATYRKVDDLLKDLNDPDPAKSLNPVKIFSKLHIIIGSLEQEPNALKLPVLLSTQNRLKVIAQEMTNLPLTPASVADTRKTVAALM